MGLREEGEGVQNLKVEVENEGLSREGRDVLGGFVRLFSRGWDC